MSSPDSFTSSSMTRSQVVAWLRNFNFKDARLLVSSIEDGKQTGVNIYRTGVTVRYCGDGRFYVSLNDHR